MYYAQQKKHTIILSTLLIIKELMIKRLIIDIKFIVDYYDYFWWPVHQRTVLLSNLNSSK